MNDFMFVALLRESLDARGNWTMKEIGGEGYARKRIFANSQSVTFEVESEWPFPSHMAVFATRRGGSAKKIEPLNMLDSRGRRIEYLAAGDSLRILNKPD